MLLVLLHPRAHFHERFCLAWEGKNDFTWILDMALGNFGLALRRKARHLVFF